MRRQRHFRGFPARQEVKGEGQGSYVRRPGRIPASKTLVRKEEAEKTLRASHAAHAKAVLPAGRAGGDHGERRFATEQEGARDAEEEAVRGHGPSAKQAPTRARKTACRQTCRVAEPTGCQPPQERRQRVRCQAPLPLPLRAAARLRKEADSYEMPQNIDPD